MKNIFLALLLYVVIHIPSPYPPTGTRPTDTDRPPTFDSGIDDD